MLYIQRIILAHGQVLEPEDLFSKFVTFFERHVSQSADDQVVQFRIINIFKKWIEINWYSMNTPEMKYCFDEFVNKLEIINPKLKAHLDKAIQQAHTPLFLSEDDKKTTPIKSKRSKPKNNKWRITDFDPLEIARQLTFIDWEYCSKVKLHELLRTRWIGEKAPRLKEASQRVNDLAYWIAGQIVSIPNIKKRAEMITLFIKISKHLITLNSYNSLMAIYLAMNFASIARLTQTWKQVEKKHFVFYQKVSKLMSPRNNFKNYRNMLSTVQPPLVLCQEILLKDLLYQEEGREDYVSEGVINVEKLDEIGRLIDQFRMCQLKRYPITKLPELYDLLKDIEKSLDMDEAASKLDKQSISVEPGSLQFAPHYTASSHTRSMGAITTKRTLSNEKRKLYSNPRPLSPRESGYDREDDITVKFDDEEEDIDWDSFKGKLEDSSDTSMNQKNVQS